MGVNNLKKKIILMLHGITVLTVKEDLILLEREFQSLMEEGKNEFRMTDDKVMWGLVSKGSSIGTPFSMRRM